MRDEGVDALRKGYDIPAAVDTPSKTLPPMRTGTVFAVAQTIDPITPSAVKLMTCTNDQLSVQDHSSRPPPTPPPPPPPSYLSKDKRENLQTPSAQKYPSPSPPTPD